MKIAYTLIIVLGLSFAGLAYGNDNGQDHGTDNGQGQGHGPCADDVQKFCKDVKPGGGAIIKCLKEHKDELSSGCKEKGDEMKEKIKDMKEACQSDVAKFCKDVKMGGGRIISCLKQNSGSLSEGCKAALPQKPQ